MKGECGTCYTIIFGEKILFGCQEFTQKCLSMTRRFNMYTIQWFLPGCKCIRWMVLTTRGNGLIEIKF